MKTLMRCVAIILVLPTLCLAEGATSQPVDQTAALRTDDLVKVTLKNLFGNGTATVLKRRVDGDGKIGLPYVGRVEIKEKTLADATRAIVKEYSDRKMATGVTMARAESADAATIKSGPIARDEYVEFILWDLDAPGKMTRKVLQVNGDGEIDLPIAGKVKVDGLEESAAEKAIVRVYFDKNIIRDPPICIRRVTQAEENTPDEQ